MTICMIAATPTPLEGDDQLCRDGLAQHLGAVWDAGVGGVLLGGSMGLMQMLSDQTWRDLLEHGTALSQDQGEVLVGVGDTSTARTLARIQFTNRLDADGVVVLTPYLWRLDDDALADYYRALAEASRHPVYLYDLPALTHRPLSRAVLEKLVDVPNLRGIKCSGSPDMAIQTARAFGDRFRVVMAQPQAADIYLRAGFRDQLDGLYALAPRWAAALAHAAEAEDWERAQQHQLEIAELLRVIQRDPLGVCDVLWRMRGWAGTILPRPMRSLGEAEAQTLRNEAAVKCWFQGG